MRMNIFNTLESKPFEILPLITISLIREFLFGIRNYKKVLEDLLYNSYIDDYEFRNYEFLNYRWIDTYTLTEYHQITKGMYALLEYEYDSSNKLKLKHINVFYSIYEEETYRYNIENNKITYARYKESDKRKAGRSWTSFDEKTGNVIKSYSTFNITETIYEHAPDLYDILDQFFIYKNLLSNENVYFSEYSVIR